MLLLFGEMMKCENCGSISSTSILGLCTSCNEKFEEMRRAEESFSGYYCYGCNKELIEDDLWWYSGSPYCGDCLDDMEKLDADKSGD